MKLHLLSFEAMDFTVTTLGTFEFVHGKNVAPPQK